MERFETKNFLFRESCFEFYQRGQVSRIDFAEIDLVEIKRGSDSKRPFLSIFSGILLLILSIYILRSAKIGFNDFYNFFGLMDIFGSVFFIGGIAVYLIYSGLPVHPIMEIYFRNRREKFSLSLEIKRGRLEELLNVINYWIGSKLKNALK